MTGSKDQGSARKLVQSYRVFCVAFAAFLVLFAGVRIGLLRAGHQDEARASFQSVRAGARTAMAAYEARDDAYFSGAMRELAQGDRAIELFALYERGQGVYYFLARRTGLFPVPPAPTANMTALPAYRAPSLTTLKLVSTFGSGEADRKVTVEALYTILGGADIHRVGKEIVYLLLVFLIVTATMLLLVTSVSSRGTERGAREPAPQRAPEPSVATEQHEAAPVEPTFEPAVAPVVEPLARPSVEPSVEPLARPLARPEATVAGPAPAASSRSFYSEASGLVYQDLLPTRLRSELDRAAASDQDMVLALIGIDGRESISGADAVYTALAARLRATFPYRDLVFEHGKGYAVIVPDMNLDKAMVRLEDLRIAIAGTLVEGQEVTVSVGIAARNGRLISEATLLKEATHSLARAVQEGANQVIAFRADPDKFRKVLAT
jgi:diguanylate cyclase (GGDEF)-like protein